MSNLSVPFMGRILIFILLGLIILSFTLSVASYKCTVTPENETKNSQDKGEEEMFGITNKKEVISVEGMMCGHCAARVEKALTALKGVDSVTVDLDKKTVSVVAAVKVSAEQMKKAITDAGYTVVG